jgi:citrate/tricarballylate utilization protein
VPASDLLREGERILTICNACRYCEGYCAVFPAMERRLDFGVADLHYLANLCHNCASCYYACQYAPPHEFAVNVPKTLAGIRARSYQQYAWPGPLAGVFRKNGLAVSLVLALCLIASLIAAARLGGAGGADFYCVIPHGAMIAAFGALSIFILLAMAAGAIRFWRESGEVPVTLSALRTALGDTLKLTYLDGGGAGCTYPGELPSQARRWFHHFTFYGFALCFAATSVAAIYHYVFGWRAPYGYLTLPVVLGTLGGIGLLIGPAGLYLLKQRRDRATGDDSQYGMDVAFLMLLFVTSLTGLLLLALRETSAMGALLVVHLGMVAALFLTLPYGKFVHGIYRFAALVRYAFETRSITVAPPLEPRSRMPLQRG